MKTGKMYLGIGQAGGGQRARERIRGRERSSVGGEGKWRGLILTIGRINT